MWQEFSDGFAVGFGKMLGTALALGIAAWVYWIATGENLLHVAMRFAARCFANQ